MARFWPRRRSATTQATEERVETVPPPPPRPFWPWLLLLLLVVLGALAASWYFATRDETVDAEEVPDVVGLQQDAAERRLENQGFEDEVKPADSERPPGTVIAQRPDAGTVYGEGGIVVISVARSPQQVEVPDVSGLRVGRALARLRGAGFTARAQGVRSRRPAGTVVRQVPAPGTEVQRGSAIVVLVSAQQGRAAVPDVIGMSAAEATRRLTRAGFRTEVGEAPSGPPGVRTQDPPAGTRAELGSVVRILVATDETRTTTTVTTTTATAPTRAIVPSTGGQDEATAISAIEGAGFRARVLERTVSDPADDGRVIQQSPAGGTRAPPGSTVTITVGRLR
jgi:eukaryotic-like serine/threonine-protein kinase